MRALGVRIHLKQRSGKRFEGFEGNNRLNQDLSFKFKVEG